MEERYLRTFEDKITDWAQTTDRPWVPRTTEAAHVLGKATAIIGMRRTGKTSFCQQHAMALGVPRHQTLYLNFEDDRLDGLSLMELSTLPDIFFRRNPGVPRHDCWFFLDEIQNVAGWEKFVRRLLDEEPIHIWVTGSSAKLLSRELATSLRGRCLTTELYPFSFAEFLTARNRPWQEPIGSALRSHLEHEWMAYLDIGGFPEVTHLSAELRVQVLQDYVGTVVLRDVMERWGIHSPLPIRWLTRRLLSSPCGKFSINKLFQEMKSQGLKVGKDTVHEILAHLEDAFLLSTVPIATSSERVRQTNPRKCYPADTGLIGAFTFSKNTGHRLETAVQVELRRRRNELEYYVTSSGFEVDFLATHPIQGPALVQVCSDATAPDTRARELRALEEAMHETGLPNATLITQFERGEAKTPHGEIKLVPAWRWMLGLAS